MSAVARDSRRVVEVDLLEDLEEEEEELDLLEEDLDDEELDLEDDEDLLDELEDLDEPEEETSKIFRTRPVVGSVVEDSEGLWET